VQGSEKYLFPCGRWLARDEDDGEIVRELVPTQLVTERLTKSGQLKRTDSELKDTLKSKLFVFFCPVFSCLT